MTVLHNTIRQLVHKVDAVLLPPDCKQGITPYVTLCYLGIFFFNYFFELPPIEEVLIGLASVGIFLTLYFRAYWVSRQQVGWYMAAIWLLGVSLAQMNPGSSVYVVYAAAMTPMLGSVRRATIGLVVQVVGTVIAALLLDIPDYFIYPGVFFSAMIGVLNIYFWQMELKNQALKLSQSEIQRLATVAERERIARDLHDLIGHTFSVITLKAELANRLMDVDLERARKELKDLENLSRDSLSQVREAVSGYRKSDLASELVNARLALEARDIHFDYKLPQAPVSSDLDREFAIIVREAVTNIIRHSNASLCKVSVIEASDGIKLEIFDNGQSDEFIEGNGLMGIRERAESIDGQFNVDHNDGTALRIVVPV